MLGENRPESAYYIFCSLHRFWVRVVEISNLKIWVFGKYRRRKRIDQEWLSTDSRAVDLWVENKFDKRNGLSEVKKELYTTDRFNNRRKVHTESTIETTSYLVSCFIHELIRNRLDSKSTVLTFGTSDSRKVMRYNVSWFSLILSSNCPPGDHYSRLWRLRIYGPWQGSRNIPSRINNVESHCKTPCTLLGSNRRYRVWLRNVSTVGESFNRTNCFVWCVRVSQINSTAGTLYSRYY